MRFTCSLLLTSVLLAGCGQYSNPNDLSSIPQVDRMEVAYSLLKQATDALDVKYQKGQLTDEERLAKIREYAEELLTNVDKSQVPQNDLWQYAEILRISRRWPEAEEILMKAIKVPGDEDRRIQDTLRLSQAQAHNGKFAVAIETAKKTLDAKDEDAAPILLGCLYEIAPIIKGHGQDPALADLLKGAIACHERTKVDPNTQEGKIFNSVRRFHIRKAETFIEQLKAGL
ncbi:MAG: hypothetical protein WCK51_02330 [Armatimonadota bacterium]